TARVSPDTSTPLTLPLSTRYATTESQVPLSGSSPIQHGQSTLQVHTSRMLPCSRYAICSPPSFRVGRCTTPVTPRRMRCSALAYSPLEAQTGYQSGKIVQ